MLQPYSALQEENFEISYVMFRQKIKMLQLVKEVSWTGSQDEHSTGAKPSRMHRPTKKQKNGHRKVPMANIDL